jgi:hypothetical protein
MWCSSGRPSAWAACAGEDRLEGIINPQIREVLGADGVTSNTILSDDRAVLMHRITATCPAEASIQLGLEVLDVRLKQTNLPDQNLEATFARMRAEREREATDEIARGNEAAQRVRAQADRTVVELVSEAQREAEITRGEADAERNRVFAEAFGQDPEFFEFYRSMTAYERALRQQNSTMVISPDSEFFEFLDGTGLSSPAAQQLNDWSVGGARAAPRPDRIGGRTVPMSIGYALLFGFGMVLVIEGLAFALAPRRMEELLRVLAEVPARNPPHDRIVCRRLWRDRFGTRAGRRSDLWRAA